MQRDAHEQNRRSWNLATRAHNSHKRDQAAFLAAGGSTLFADELALLGAPEWAWPKEQGGEDMSPGTSRSDALAGRELVHLQCNAGQDSLSLAALGARVTGVDISDEAIAAATALADASGIAARFVRSDVYDFLAAADERGRYDLAFATYGALGWLSDLGAWARGVAALLRPGGRLVLVEFHPVAFVFDEALRPVYPYFGDGRPVHNREGVGDYVAASGDGLAPSGYEAGEAAFTNPEPCHEFPWSVGELVTAVAAAGMIIEELREYPYSNGCKIYEGMRALPGRRWALPEGLPAMPLMIGLRARRPA